MKAIPVDSQSNMDLRHLPSSNVSNAVWQIAQCITHALFGLCLPLVLHAYRSVCACCCPWATVQ